MKNKVKYLINISDRISTIGELAQYLTLYSSIFFSEDGKKVSIVDKNNNEEYTTDSNIISIDSENANYFTIEVYQEDGINYLELFDKFINDIINMQKDMQEQKFFIIEDGISMYYSSKAYPMLFRTETTLREFITEMMCFFGSKNWGSSMGKKLITSSDNKYQNDVLYNSDFKQLTIFLTKPYKEDNEDAILDSLRKKVEEIDENNGKSAFLEIRDFIREKKPYTIWNRFAKKYAGASWELEQFGQKMDRLYILRCKIAHSNKFTKENFLEFKELSNEMIEEMTNLTKKIETIKNLDKETMALLNEAEDELNVDDEKDTIVVPAHPGGFKDVFLKENKWYHIRISDNKLNSIKYIAAYEAQTNKCIQYYAEIDRIENSDIKDGYKVVYFKDNAKLLANKRKIKLGDNHYYAPQSLRYVSSEKLFDENVITLDQLFN